MGATDESATQVDEVEKAGDSAFMRALLFGAVAALLGLVAGSGLGSSPVVVVAVGLLVGYAVRKGAGGRGGWTYQTLAMILTGLSIAVTVTPVGEGFEIALVVPFLTSGNDPIGVIVIAVALFEAWTLNRRVVVSAEHVAVHARALSVGAAAVTAPGPANAAAPPRTGWRKWTAGAGAAGVLLLKFKWVLLFVATKAKVLLVGLTQAKTLLSMALAIGVYTTIYGWQFALGLVVSIYVHEMGHVVWLRRFGIPATAPMFIPGLGAFVRLKAHPANAGEDARIGLAGPVWGAAAAILALALGVAFGRPILFAIARVGAWINVFNLLPVWQLDGGRGFAALSRRQRWIVAAVVWAVALAGIDGVFFLVAIAATFRAASAGTAPEQGDRNVLLTYLVLVAGLATIMVGAGKI